MIAVAELYTEPVRGPTAAAIGHADREPEPAVMAPQGCCPSTNEQAMRIQVDARDA